MNKEVKIKKDREKAESYRICNLTLGRTRKFIPHRGTREVGDGLMEPFHRDFDMLQYFTLICCSISKRFCL